GLRRFYDSEGVLLSGHRKIVRIIAGNLQEHAGVRAAFVSLSGGMKETRAKAQAGCHLLAVAHSMANHLQRFLMRGVHFDVSQQGHIVAWIELVEMRSEKAGERAV